MARRRRPPRTTRALRRRETVVIAPAPPGQGAASVRPDFCPSAAIIGAKLAALQAFFLANPDSDDRATAVDNFNASVPPGCMSKAQAQVLLTITGELRGQARAEESSFALFGGILDRILPILKVAAGGAGLLIVGGALVYVAGRNTSPGRAVRGAAGAAATVARIPGRAIPGRAELQAERTRSRAEARRSLARARVETTVGSTGRERVRTVSRAEGRRRLIEEAERSAEAREASRRRTPESGRVIEQAPAFERATRRKRKPSVRHA